LSLLVLHERATWELGEGINDLTKHWLERERTVFTPSQPGGKPLRYRFNWPDIGGDESNSEKYFREETKRQAPICCRYK